jgi:drug/metabolite transporter (DMT)-like permease
MTSLPTSVKAESILSTAVQAVVGTAILYSLLNYLIEKIGVGLQFLNVYLIPIFVMLNGAIFLDEQITIAMLGGVALILIGVTIRARARASPATPPVQAPSLAQLEMNANLPETDIEAQ